MPFLRFARDKRGYETTSLVHTGRRHGRQRQRILYWFRTPPGVKVGRPALDEAAIRWIEEHNPDVEFDWQKILEAKPPSAPPSEDQRLRRSRRDKPERRRSAPPQPPSAAAAPASPIAEPELAASPAPGDPPPLEEPIVSEEELEEVFVQLADSDEEPKAATVASPIQQAVGPKDLTRLRGRYAELLARITERGGDAPSVEALRAQADALNPDTWVTEEEVRKGLAEFESKLRELRAALGLRRRRRSRRGGRRRSAARPQGAPAPETEPDRGEG